MTVLRCPTCHWPYIDDPDATPTNPDGTAYDDTPCLDCWDQTTHPLFLSQWERTP